MTNAIWEADLRFNGRKLHVLADYTIEQDNMGQFVIVDSFEAYDADTFEPIQGPSELEDAVAHAIEQDISMGEY